MTPRIPSSSSLAFCRLARNSTVAPDEKCRSFQPPQPTTAEGEFPKRLPHAGPKEWDWNPPGWVGWVDLSQVNREERTGCYCGTSSSRPRPVNVRVKAPPGIGAVQTSSGRHITIGVDGIVEMSEANAFYLTSYGWTILGDAT